jgi:hypothetical protein
MDHEPAIERLARPAITPPVSDPRDDVGEPVSAESPAMTTEMVSREGNRVKNPIVRLISNTPDFSATTFP